MNGALSGMNGIEFMLWMKEHGIDTPVIMLTAAGSETTAVEVMKAGAYEYFRKDQINTSHLASVIRSVHEKHRIARERLYIEQEQRRLHDRIVYRPATGGGWAKVRLSP